MQEKMTEVTVIESDSPLAEETMALAATGTDAPGTQALEAAEAPEVTETSEALDVSTFAEEKQSLSEEDQLKPVLAAILYATKEPMPAAAIAQGLGRDEALVQKLISELIAFYEEPQFGFQIHSKAGGYYFGTKPEFNESLRQFFDAQKQPLKLSPAALETLCIIAYKQPVTGPEIAQIRGTQGVGSIKPLLDRKLITTAGRKDVVGKPVLYKTTPEFLVQFGLKDLKELPTLKEFEELRRLAMDDDMPPPVEAKLPQPEAESAGEPDAEQRAESA
jgi:segregation and condensation protein B